MINVEKEKLFNQKRENESCVQKSYVTKCTRTTIEQECENEYCPYKSYIIRYR